MEAVALAAAEEAVVVAAEEAEEDVALLASDTSGSRASASRDIGLASPAPTSAALCPALPRPPPLTLLRSAGVAAAGAA